MIRVNHFKAFFLITIFHLFFGNAAQAQQPPIDIDEILICFPQINNRVQKYDLYDTDMSGVYDFRWTIVSQDVGTFTINGNNRKQEVFFKASEDATEGYAQATVRVEVWEKGCATQSGCVPDGCYNCKEIPVIFYRLPEITLVIDPDASPYCIAPGGSQTVNIEAQVTDNSGGKVQVTPEWAITTTGASAAADAIYQQLAQDATNAGSYELDITVDNSHFDASSNKITLEITGLAQCQGDSGEEEDIDVITLEFERNPEFTGVSDYADCVINGGNLGEIIPAQTDSFFSYTWSKTSNTGGDISFSTTGTNNSGLSIDQIDFDNGSSAVTIEMNLNAVGGCNVSDQSVTLTFYRIPDPVTITDISLCELNNASAVIAVAEKTDENIATFEYQWTLAINTGGSFSITPFGNMYSGVQFDNIQFSNGSAQISADLELTISGSDSSCSVQTATIPVVINRLPDAMGVTALTFCELDGTTNLEVISASSENITAYQYNWSVSSLSNGSFSLEEFGNMDSGLRLNGISFNAGETTITANIDLTVDGVDASCTNTHTIPLTIHRLPDQLSLTAQEFCTLNGADNLQVVAENGTSLSGYSYSWTMNSISGGTVSMSATGTDGSGLEFDAITFGTGSSEITANVRLEITGMDASCGTNTVDIPVTLYRIPDQLSLTSIENCILDGTTDLEVVTANTEVISGYTYTYTLSALSGGTFNLEAQGSDGSGLELDNISFATGSASITANINLSVGGLNASCTTSSIEIPVTLYRQVDQLSLSAIEECLQDGSTGLLIATENTNPVDSYTYTWSLTGLSGGSIDLRTSGTDDSGLYFDNISFTGSSTEITADLSLTVSGMDASCGTNTVTVSVNIHRLPDQLSLTALEFCTLNGADNLEVVAENGTSLSGYSYSWTMNSISGGTVSMSATGTDGSGLEFDAITFGTGSSEITANVRLEITGMDASCGTNTVDIPVTLYRIPDQLSLTSIENCILDGTTDLEVITANTEVISGYTYTYSLSALSGGTFSLDAQGSDGSGLELDNISFATGSASITANINLSVGGLNASCTTSSIDIPVTLYRQVDQLTLTAIEECLQDGSTGLLIATENTNPVDSYTYSWSLTGLSGGSIDLRTSGTDDSGLYFDNISFTGSSTEITADLSLTVSGIDASCGTNTVTVSVNIHRLPDQLSLTAQEFCTLNGTDNLQIVAENGTSLSGYSYSWTMNSISGGTVSMSATGTDGSGLEFDAITFGTGSSEITANVRLEITGMDASCGTNTVDIPVTLYRIPDQLSLTSIENCILDGTTDLEVITANTEVISGYTYTYSLSALSGGTFSLDAQGSDGSGLELDNISFATGSASITANINLSVGGLNASCTTSSIDIPVTLYRQVDQLTLTAIEECLQDGSTGLLIATENTNPVDSYTYSWSLTGLSGGSIDLRTSGTDDSGLYFDNISFTGSSTEITADLSLTVSGIDASCGTNTVTVSVNIHRLPDQLSLTAQEFCTLNGTDNLQIVAENGTSLSGYSYSWTMNSISGGTVNMSSTGTDGSGLEFDAITFGTGSSEITANVRLEITGMDASCGTNTVDIPVTLYRIPDQLSLTSIENCILDGTTDLEVITANTEVISGYTYTYTLSALSGGTFSLDAQGSDGSGLELDNISFATGSASITANINLSVGGLNASCTTSSIDIPVTLYRQVDQLTLTAIEECLQDGSTGLLIATENTNPVDSYTYSWSLTGLSGGSIDLRTSGTDDSGLYFDNISFTGSSTEITADLSLTVSGMDASCGTNTVTVSVNIHRLPDQLSLTAQEFCTLNGADNLQVVAENGTSLSGYSYSWTMNSISGGTVSMSATGTDGSGLEFDAITFGTGSSEITANVRLEITGMDASCGTNTVDIPVTLYRIPDQLSLTSIENCILDGTTDLEVVTANTEVISGYTYTYTLSALSGGTFSLDAQGSDGSGLELDNISFATGSASITANINLSVGGLNASCTTSSIDIPVTLYRQVDQLTLTAIEECLQDGSTGLLIATENTNPVDSYTYSWSLTGLSGGSIDLRTSGTDDSGLYFDNISFTGSSTEITADLSLTVSGIDASCGTNTVTVSVNIHRLPDQLSLTAQEFCTLNGTDNLQVAAENGTSLSGYSYSWTMNSISGGTVNMSATGTDGSGLEFDAITFGTGSSEITANVRLEITGMDASCGTNTVDIPVTLYRIPDQLSLTSLEECAADGETSLSMLSPNTENISGYTYSWSLSNFTGGTFTYSAYGNNNSGLDFESISFNGTSNEITADLQLIVAGISASCTSNTITIPVTIHRIPEQFAQNSIEECVLNGTTNLSVVDEVANPIDGYTYTWSISNIDGGSFNISPTGANNSGLNFDNIAFTDGRTQITADVSLEVGGISSTCNSTHTITVEINRIPDQLTLSSIISCEMDGAGNIQVVDPNTVALTDYTYTWSLDNLSGGAINIQTLGADNSGVEFNDIDFFGGGSKITADLNLSISGLDASCTQSTVSIPVEIYRQPDLSAYIAFESCVYNETEDLVLYEEQAETIVGYNYTWNISGISGGNVSYSSFGNNNSGFQLDEVTFNGGSNEITATIELELEGLDGSCTNTTVSIPLTLHRLPDQFDLAEIFIFLCEVDGTVVVEAVAENEVEIDDYVYAWTLSTPSGGTFNMEDFGVNNSGVNFKDIFFDAGSEVITANLNLVVNGLNPVCASASKDIPVTISLKAEEVVLPDTIPCVVDGESEVVFAEPRAELLVGITYSWAVSDLSGGTLETEAYGLSDTGLRFNNVNFEDGVDEITGTVTLTQTTDCSVTEQDTTFTLRRKADLTQFTPQSLCLVEGASNVELFAPQTETVSSFAYAWQIRSVNGGSFSLLATGSDSSGVNLNDVNFDEGVSQIIAEVEVTVTGGCETVSEVVDIVIERSADYSSFTDQDLCVRNGEVDVALFSERTELISGFTYGWTITSISGGTLSLVEFGNNNSGLQLTDIQFDDDATNIVVNIEVAVDGSCDTSPHNVEVTINRKPRLDDIADIVLCEVDGAASVLAMDELSDAVTLFSYNSTLVANSLDGGTFSLAQFGDSNSGINFENINFADGSNQILAEIEIEVQGGCEVVSAIIPVEINRKADLSYLADLELCELNGATNVVAIDTLAESVAGLSYVWAIDNSTLSGGTFELLPMGTNQTGLNLNNIQFLADSSQITADIIVISQGGCEDVSTTIRITINRELEFSSYTDVVLCLDGNEDTVLVYDEMEENISTYNFQWSLSENLQGGVMTVTPFGNMSSGLNFEDIEFADGSLEITGELLLTEVEGACDFSPLTIPVQIQRKPNLDEIPDISLCEVDGTTSVVAWEGISEAISAWNYKYTIDAASLSGGSFTLSTSGNSNSSLSLNTISFAEGSNQITAKVDVEVSGGCETVTKEILVEILRKEDLSTLEDVSVCETDSSTNVVLYDVFEETITGFSYSWSFVTGSVDGGSFTLSPQGSNNSGLEANDITFDVNSYEINAELELTVLGSCEDVSTIVSVQIRRSATFDQPLIYDFCAGENGSLVAVSNDTDLFNFTWAVDSISGANASRTTSLRTSIENTTTATLQDLFVNNEDFLDEEGIIEVVATITSTNKQNTSCTTSETYTIQFVRIPEVELPSSSVEGCSETPNILYPFGADDYTDVYNFSWSLVESSLTGTSTVGTTEIRSLINNSTAQNLEVLILDTYFLDASVTEINFDVELEATNKVVESCQSPSSSAVYSFTIKRSPLVELTETEGSCEDGSIQLQSNYAELSFLAYSWTLNDVQGGGLTSSDLNTFALNLQADYFDPTSYELSAWAKLEVENTLISDGCIGVDSTWVYFHRTPDPSFTMTSTVGCANQETVFDATSSGVPLGANTYEWDFNYDGTTFNTDLTTTDSIVSHEFSGEGTYTVALRITTSLGCTSSDIYQETFTIHPSPEAVFTAPLSVCIDEMVNFTNSSTSGIPNGSLSYSWSYLDEDGVEVGTDSVATPSYTFTTAGVYTVSLTVENELGCLETTTQDIEVLDLADISLSDNVFICFGESATLSVTGGARYEWSTGETTNEISVSPESDTLYTVTTYNINDCPRVDTVFVSVIPTGTLYSTQEACEGELVTLDASLEYDGLVQEVTWSTGERGTSIEVTEAGLYYYDAKVVHIESGVECTYRNEIDLTLNPLPAENYTDEVLFCFENNATLELSAVDGEQLTYLWLDTEETSRSITVSEEGLYSVLITDMSHDTECTTLEEISVREVCPPNFTPPTAFTPNDDGLNDYFYIQGEYLQNIKLGIYNRWGENIFYKEYADHTELKDPKNGWDGTYRGEKVPLGAYVYILEYESEFYPGEKFKEERSITVIY